MKNIVLDCMGADNSPHDFVKGAIGALDEIQNLHIILVGNKDDIQKELNKYKCDKSRISIVDAKDVILGEDSPVKAIQRKKDSSLIVGINELLNKNYDGIISAGNSGAFLAACVMLIGKIEGVNRPALAPVLHIGNKKIILLDAGATVDCKVNNLLEFAKIGSIYYRELFNKKNPEVKLLNIGEESTKGNCVVKNTYNELLNDTSINFKGNIEARNIMSENVDVIVCDGFVGNVTLKVMEGVGTYFLQEINSNLNKIYLYKILKKFFSKFCTKLKNKYDYQKQGGAFFVGVKKICIKAHGSSNHISIKNSIEMAYKLSFKNFVENLEKDLLKK